MPATVSNPRDLIVELLGRLLYVERRLADAVLRELADAVHDDELRASLEVHRDETKTHAERIEAAFHRLEIAAYTAVLTLADATGYGEAVAELAASLRDEEAARATLEAALPRLASGD
jgi:ferritin-like metal-binding protein YciE